MKTNNEASLSPSSFQLCGAEPAQLILPGVLGACAAPCVAGSTVFEQQRRRRAWLWDGGTSSQSFVHTGELWAARGDFGPM